MMARHFNTNPGEVGGLAPHIPVMIEQVMTALAPEDNKIYIDGTFGAGGYTRAILEAANCHVLAIDRDPDAIAGGQNMVDEFDGRLILVPGLFSNLAEFARDAGFAQIDGVTLDIGVSSMQIDDAGRGFSFQQDGPLDMRMGATGPSAADVINKMDKDDLADILFILGEERRSRAIARALVAARADKLFSRTGEVADLVEKILGGRRGAKRHPATKTFQALRTFVNRELEELVRALYAAESVLWEGGRLAVVAFHSLEDRIVKRFIADAAHPAPAPSRHVPLVVDEGFAATFTPMFRGAREPDESEIARNPRSRSARLRAAMRTGAAARSMDSAHTGLPPLPDLSQITA